MDRVHTLRLREVQAGLIARTLVAGDGDAFAVIAAWTESDPEAWEVWQEMVADGSMDALVERMRAKGTKFAKPTGSAPGSVH